MSKNKPENLIELKAKYGFYLKPIAKLNISVQLPQLSTGKAISTIAVIEKINKRAKLQFKSLKITKTTIDFLRFEGELKSLKELDTVEQRLDGVKIKLDGFDEHLKLKATRVKIGPFKHDWETFFRDNPHMDELKPGYRPDTVLIQNIPLKWFNNGSETLKTNWLISVFSVFGEIRRFHIPLLDEIEKEKQSALNKKDDKSSFKKFSFNSERTTFDVYLMYNDYVGFMNAIDGLRGMKLVKCNDDNDRIEYIEHEIKVDFDKTKHLSDKAIRRRQIAKKYGIETLEDLNEYKKKAKERKALYEQRKKQLKEQKKCSNNLLKFLARLVEIEEKKREEEELKALNEKLLKERLIEEEKKLRNKLIERQRSLMMEKLKKKGEFKDEKADLEELNDSSERNSSDNYSKAISDNHDSYMPSSYNKEFNHHLNYNQDFNNRRQNLNFNKNRYSKQEYPLNFRNPNHPSSNYQQNHHPKNFVPLKSASDFIFKNQKFTPNQFRNQGFNRNDQSNSFNPKFKNKLLNFQKPHFIPYQTNKPHLNRTYSHQNKNNDEMFNERFDERGNYDQRLNNYQNKPNYYERPNNHQDRQNNYQDRPNNHQDKPNNYQDRPNNYQDRPNNYQDRVNNYPQRSNYQDRFNNYQESSNNYHERMNYNKSFNKSNYREQNRPNSFDRSNNYYVDEQEGKQEAKSTKPKLGSLIVLPKRIEDNL